MRDHHSHNIYKSVWQVQIQRLLFGAAQTGDMFQHKTGEIFKILPDVFGIADDILVVGYDTDGKDHDEMLQQICRWVNLKLDKEKCHFRCTSFLFFSGVVSRHSGGM